MMWAVEVTDPDPVLGGKVVRGSWESKQEAEGWARREQESAAECGITGVTTRVFAVEG